MNHFERLGGGMGLQVKTKCANYVDKLKNAFHKIIATVSVIPG